MSIIVEFFIAPDDQAASTVLESGPEGTFETLQCGNFDAITAIEEWDRLLTGRSADALERDEVPRIIAGDSPFIMAASAALQQALVNARPEDLLETAVRWIEQEELHGYEPELFADILGELASLAGTANEEGHAVYCWMC